MKLNDCLKEAKAKLDEIRTLVDAGEPLDRADLRTLDQLKSMVTGLRDYAICNDPSSGGDLSRRWKLCDARISQIRAKGPKPVFMKR